MSEEIKALREEITKLRERVAVLECAQKPVVHLNPRQWSPVVPMMEPPMREPIWAHRNPPIGDPPSWPRDYTVTCGATDQLARN